MFSALGGFCQLMHEMQIVYTEKVNGECMSEEWDLSFQVSETICLSYYVIKIREGLAHTLPPTHYKTIYYRIYAISSFFEL
jgi:hypothetical protein